MDGGFLSQIFLERTSPYLHLSLSLSQPIPLTENSDYGNYKYLFPRSLSQISICWAPS